MIGGQLLRFTSWRGVFAVLALLGTVIWVFTAVLLRESLPRARRQRGGLRATLRTIGGLLRDRPLAGYVLAGSLGFAAMFAYISASSFVLQEAYGASPQIYSLLFALNSAGLAATGQVNGRVLLGRFPSHRILGSGLVVLVSAGAALVLFVTVVHAGLPWVASVLFFAACPVGVILPTATALALQRAPHAAGAASALLGAAQFLMGSLSGLGGQSTAAAMAVSVLVLALAAAGCFLVLCRPWRQTLDPLTGCGGGGPRCRR